MKSSTLRSITIVAMVLGGMVLSACGQIPAESVPRGDQGLPAAAGLSEDSAKKPPAQPPAADVLRGCMLSSGGIRIVSQEGLCTKKETPVSWNISAGPTGPQGEPGPQGAPGLQGPVGIVAPIVVTFDNVTLARTLVAQNVYNPISTAIAQGEFPQGSYLVNGALVLNLNPVDSFIFGNIGDLPTGHDFTCTIMDSTGTPIQKFDIRMNDPWLVANNSPIMTVGVPIRGERILTGEIVISCEFQTINPVTVNGNVVLIPINSTNPSDDGGDAVPANP